MSKCRIEWGEPQPWGYGKTMTPGSVGGLLVAGVVAHPNGTWGVLTYLAPLPDSLDQLTDTAKVSEWQAKATAQRVVNAFVKILNGE